MSNISELGKKMRAYSNISLYAREHEARELLNQAADAIEELSAKVARQNMELSSQYYGGGWISVDKRLPEDGEKVLVWYEYFSYGKPNCKFQTYGIGYQFEGHWSGGVNGENARCIAWQPLPPKYEPEEK